MSTPLADTLAALLDRHRDAWCAAHLTLAVRAADGTAAVVGDVDHRYDLASITKLYTTLAVLVAVEEGAVTLDDPAGPPGATLAHLLAHASGLAFEGDTVLAAPGTRRIYSNTGIEAALAHVEASSGIPGATYAAEAVLEPLGLAHTDVAGSPAAGWRATAGDVLTLLDQVRHPTLVTPATMARATTVAFPGLAGVLPGWGRHDPLDWGLGFEVRDGKAPHWTPGAASPATVGHFGGAGTFAWHDPDAGVTCVGLGDRPFDDWARTLWPTLGAEVLTNAA